MLRILTASSILALAAVPAIAQQAEPLVAPPPAEAPIATEEAPAPVEPATAAAPAEPRTTTVAKIIDTEFPAYDTNKNGDLEQPEFTKWVLALHGASNDANAKAMDEAAKLKWADGAFASADADKSKKISKAEMNKFLLG
jgi:hypothetical protein